MLWFKAFHIVGVVTWFVAERDTRTNKVHWTALPHEAPAPEPSAQVPAGNTGGEATLA